MEILVIPQNANEKNCTYLFYHGGTESTEKILDFIIETKNMSLSFLFPITYFLPCPSVYSMTPCFILKQINSKHKPKSSYICLLIFRGNKTVKRRFHLK